jgi:radical SAM protein with 4Fe4S-binding SPASM domain
MSESSPSARLNLLTLERNIPVSVTLELTRRCPLACAHCYLPETRGRARPAAELSAAQWEKILRQLAAAGGLYLVFTGGEPLLRPDLERLCAFAKKLNFDVRVFSTGLGLGRRRALELKKAGVSAFEISFYGRPEIHDGVTGLRGSYAQSLAAARLLKKNGLKVKIKIPLTRANLSQAAFLRALARREGFGIAFDPVITAANDGDKAALRLRLGRKGMKQAIKLLGGLEQPVPPEPSPAMDFLCGAGRNVCAVGPDGALYPCLQLPVKLGDLARRSFSAIWKSSPWLKNWRLAGEKDLKACAGCRDAAYCSRCPGVSLVEEGDVFAPNAPACAMAAARNPKKREKRAA